MRAIFLLLLLTITGTTARAEAPSLPAEAARIYQQARDTGRFFADAEKLAPEIRVTSDGKSYALAIPAKNHLRKFTTKTK